MIIYEQEKRQINEFIEDLKQYYNNLIGNQIDKIKNILKILELK